MGGGAAERHGRDAQAGGRRLEPSDDRGIDRSDGSAGARAEFEGDAAARLDLGKGSQHPGLDPLQHGGVVGAHVEAEGEAAWDRGQAVDGWIGVEAAERHGHREAGGLLFQPDAVQQHGEFGTRHGGVAAEAARCADMIVPPDDARIRIIDPLSYGPFVTLLDASTLILTDSGGIQEEAPALGKPVLVLRDETERPEAITAGVAKLVGTDEQRIVDATAALLDDPAAYARMAQGASPYGDGRAAARILDAIERYFEAPPHARHAR